MSRSSLPSWLAKTLAVSLVSLCPSAVFAQSGGGGGGAGSGGAGGAGGGGGIEERKQEAQPPGVTPSDPLLATDPLGFLDPLRDLRDQLHRNLDLYVLTSYTFFYQDATHTLAPRNDQFGGRLDFAVDWKMIHYGNNDSGGLGVLVRSAENIGQTQAFDLSDNVGSILGTNSLQGGGPQIPVSVNLLYWKQTFFDRNLSLYFGKLHPNQYIDLSTVADDESRQFMAGAYTGNASNPRSGIWATGLAAELRLPEDFYVHAIAVDAKGQTATGPHSVGDHKFYEAVEVGYKRNVSDAGLGIDYRLFGWHNQNDVGGDGEGIGFGFDHELPSGWTPFARWGYGNPRGTAVEQFASLGIAHVRPFGRSGDMFGISGSWSQPSNRGFRQEQLYEMFYRLRLTESLEFSPDLQYLHNVANPNSRSDVIVSGARLRVIF